MIRWSAISRTSKDFSTLTSKGNFKKVNRNCRVEKYERDLKRWEYMDDEN